MTSQASLLRPPTPVRRHWPTWLLALMTSVSAVSGTLAPDNRPGQGNSEYSIGSYYYPGWKADTAVNPPRQPWDRIKAYPEREPLLGWYAEGNIDVMDQQLRWMHDYGLDFVVFDWYWTSNRPRQQHALDAYMQSSNKKLVKFSILWANHENYPKGDKDFRDVVQYWVDNFLKDPQYQRIDGLPVVHIFSPEMLEKKAQAFDSSTPQLLAAANEIARKAGLPGIYFTAGTPASAFASNDARAYGYRALTAYNYGLGHSFEERDQAYRKQWKSLLNDAQLPYMPAMTSGWDKRAWGGTTRDPRRDLAVSTPDTFEAHLRAAKATMDQYPDKTLRTGIICCWNEYGEGSYIEPTKAFGMQYLERVKKVFAP